MKTLILLRHAKSSWQHEGEDFTRPLNARGRDNAPLIGSWIMEQAAPELVLCSAAERTRETFARSGISTTAKFSDKLYLASAATILRYAHTIIDVIETVLVIAHNPGIAQAADKLLDVRPNDENFERFPTASCAIIEFEIQHWREVDFGSGKLRAFTTPRLL